MTISVVIPTHNEERWLPRLLRRVALLDAEVIVADNFSSDGTRQVAHDFGCTIVDGGRPGRARNLGAAAATRQTLLFLDADVYLTDRALERVRQLTQLGDQAPAVYFRVRPISSRPFVQACYTVSDWWFLCLSRIGVAHGLVNCLFLPANAFRSAGFFDEQLEPGEDVEFVRRVSRVHPTLYERDAFVYSSPRRFGTENGVTFALKTIMWEVFRLAGSRRSIFPYHWTTHVGALADDDDRWLRRFVEAEENNGRAL